MLALGLRGMLVLASMEALCCVLEQDKVQHRIHSDMTEKLLTVTFTHISLVSFLWT